VLKYAVLSPSFRYHHAMFNYLLGKQSDRISERQRKEVIAHTRAVDVLAWRPQGDLAAVVKDPERDPPDYVPDHLKRQSQTAA
jgi:hypothetical protein